MLHGSNLGTCNKCRPQRRGSIAKTSTSQCVRPPRANEQSANHVENHLPVRACYLVGIATYMFNVIKNKMISNITFQTAQLSSHSQNLRNNNLQLAKETFGPRLYNKLLVDIKNSYHQHAFKWSPKCLLKDENCINACFKSDFLQLSCRAGVHRHVV